MHKPTTKLAIETTLQHLRNANASVPSDLDGVRVRIIKAIDKLDDLNYELSEVETYRVNLWVEDTSTGEASYYPVKGDFAMHDIEDFVSDEITKLPPHLTCSGWSYVD